MTVHTVSLAKGIFGNADALESTESCISHAHSPERRPSLQPNKPSAPCLRCIVETTGHQFSAAMLDIVENSLIFINTPKRNTSASKGENG